MLDPEVHTAIAVHASGILEAVETAIPDPGHLEVLVKVAYRNVVPPDPYMVGFGRSTSERDGPALLGCSVSGVVNKVGEGTKKLKRGDRVCGFTLAHSNAWDVEQYAILPQKTCTKIPKTLSLYDAVTIPDSFVLAFCTLFDQLKLPIPTFPVTALPEDENKPILIYGAETAPGLHAVQLLKLAGYTNVIATSSSDHHDNLRSLGAKYTIDYSVQDVSKQIVGAADGKLGLAIDCLNTEGTLKIISQVVHTGATVAMLSPLKEGDTIAPDSEMLWMGLPADRSPFRKGRQGVNVVGVKTYTFQENKYLKEKLMPDILRQLLGDGLIKPNKARVCEGKTLLYRVEQALELLRSGNIGNETVVIKVG